MKQLQVSEDTARPSSSGTNPEETRSQKRLQKKSKPLIVDLRDVFRATLADRTGNVGYLGLAPDGSGYHVVVPVDIQIARGVKAGNRPMDGTPFGGYSGWAYFECPTYPWPGAGAEEELALRWKQSRANAEDLRAWGRRMGLEVEIARPE
jgi:hypothetical protein